MSFTDAALQFWSTAATAGPWDVFRAGFNLGGWIILFPVLVGMVHTIFNNWRTGVFMSKFEWVNLAIDVPSDNVQSPLAVENIFAHLAGGHETRDLVEKYIDGQYQRWFSFEIVSIEGYIQFIIRTEKKYRDLLESAIYAQYPEAEITEVEDYVKGIPKTYPNATHQCWGAEWKLVENHFYPIKTYKKFEDEKAKEYFKDPMAALLESFSRIGKGEQLWLQVLVKPTGQSWKLGGFELAKKLMGKEIKSKDTWLSKIGDFPFVLLRTIGSAFGLELFGASSKSEEKWSWGMFALTPGERQTIEDIELKVSKIGMLVKVRGVYVAEKERFNKSRVAYGLVGAMKQFTDESSNGLKPDYKITGTTAHYAFTNWRKNIKRTKLMQAYQRRSTWAGLYEYILNTEELATLWHFPVMEVKTPLLKRLGSRRAQPPPILPTEIPFEDAPHGVPIPSSSQAPAAGESAFSSDIGSVRQKSHGKEPAPRIQQKETEPSGEQPPPGSPPPNLPVI